MLIKLLYFRFQNEHLIQLAILPGPKTPENVDSFLKPIVAEFKDLSTHGLLVRQNGMQVCKAKVNLIIATGDIPAAAALARHKGHTSTFGCRLCRIETEKHDYRTCFLEADADVRSRVDFTDADPENVK